MQLKDLTDQDLIRLHDRVGRAVEAGDPLDEEVRRYGIRDLGALRLWIQDMERQLANRGLPHRTIAWPDAE